MTDIARIVATLFVLVFLGAPLALCLVALNDARKRWRQFGNALRDVHKELP